MTVHQQVAMLRDQGLTYRAIASLTQCSRSTVYRWLNPEKAEEGRAACRRWKRENPERNAAIQAAYRDRHREERRAYDRRRWGVRAEMPYDRFLREAEHG